ncbi:MAG TPA: TlpA disulfide reductase family protein [Candidatus Limnocylindrales bacterium]|nr:TlpA disulfide reductase family protein [Candidatus Limnocylindrales bacterium]
MTRGTGLRFAAIGIALMAPLMMAALVATGCKPAAAPSTGELAPEFVLPSIGGQTRKLSNYRGKVVLVNLWATWCPPCIEELPVLSRIASDYADRGLVVLGIAGDEDTQLVRDFLARSPVKFEVLLDTRGVIGTQYGITGYPETFFVDRQGRLRNKIIGPVPHQGAEPGSELIRTIDELLGG